MFGIVKKSQLKTAKNYIGLNTAFTFSLNFRGNI